MMSPAARTGNMAMPANAGNAGNASGGGAGNRGARSPFKDAMQKGVLSGAGLLTH